MGFFSCDRNPVSSRTVHALSSDRRAIFAWHVSASLLKSVKIENSYRPNFSDEPAKTSIAATYTSGNRDRLRGLRYLWVRSSQKWAEAELASTESGAGLSCQVTGQSEERLGWRHCGFEATEANRRAQMIMAASWSRPPAPAVPNQIEADGRDDCAARGRPPTSFNHRVGTAIRPISSGTEASYFSELASASCDNDYDRFYRLAGRVAGAILAAWCAATAPRVAGRTNSVDRDLTPIKATIKPPSPSVGP